MTIYTVTSWVSRRLALAALVMVLGAMAFPVLAVDGVPMASPEDVGMSSKRLARLSNIMQRYIDDDLLAGTVTLVAHRHGPYTHVMVSSDRLRTSRLDYEIQKFLGELPYEPGDTGGRGSGDPS